MKTTILTLAACAALSLCSCSTAPKPADPFDVAIQQSLGAMMGGIMGPNAGGGL